MTHNQHTTASAQPRPAGELLELEIAGVPVNFRWAPPGVFLMGKSDGEEDFWGDLTQHEVELTQGFWIAETETTQELWQAVMGNNPSYFKTSEQLPVENVSWNDCHDFVEKLNGYHADALPSGYRYVLPTEAQWEYACRAGTTTPFSFGATIDGDRANYNGKLFPDTNGSGVFKGTTTPVRSYASNPWGLYDMHGNLFEWCADWYARNFYLAPEASKDPTGPDSGVDRVLRGGSWGNCASVCRSAYRCYYLPDYRGNNFGFRLVLLAVA